ncbi:MAG: flavodoxin-dependent (E)-4-hydroxy-3-methylbut-2-enyl-diphosphate synthase, partial [Gemmatimonadota bacterium]
MKSASIQRKRTKKVMVGVVAVGGNGPITVQSMTKTDTRDVAATVQQIREMESVGCDIVRVAVPDNEAVESFKEIKKQITVPLVADVHFDYRLALESLEAGADKLRINPGNIGSKERVERIALAAKERNVPIRIGVNAGSLEKDLLEKFDGLTAEALVESALRHVTHFEDLGFEDIVLSLKASDVLMTIDSY